VRQLRYVFHVGIDAFYTFLADDGWAIASHIALSTLMALFPFLIVLTSLAGFFGSKELADQAAGLMLQIWPKQVADSLSGEIHDVLTTTRGDALTVGVVLAVYFASNGVESLRVALNRAYAVIEPRRWYWLRLESIGYTLIAAFTSLGADAALGGGGGGAQADRAPKPTRQVAPRTATATAQPPSLRDCRQRGRAASCHAPNPACHKADRPHPQP